MKSRLSDIASSKTVDSNAIPSLIDKALQEENDLWIEQNSFINPTKIDCYHNKWRGLYDKVKRKTKGVAYYFGLSGKYIRISAPLFIETYEVLPQKLQEHNERVASEKAEAAAKLIFPVEGKQLDLQQLHCIIKEVRNHLVLAGAGSGKTTTIVGFVKYLIMAGICKAEDILVLSFTNASASEMSERLKSELKVPIAASTFHKLGLDIIIRIFRNPAFVYLTLCGGKRIIACFASEMIGRAFIVLREVTLVLSSILKSTGDLRRSAA